MIEITQLEDFLNTRDERRFGAHEHKRGAERDELADPAAFKRWLVERHLVAPGSRVSEDDLELAKRLRDALRDLLAADEPQAGELDAIARELPLVVGFANEEPALEHQDTPVRMFLAQLLAACAMSAARGQWQRLKMCAASDCHWVFYDKSRNGFGRWCSMRVCGNRVKTRTYRARRRGAGSTPARSANQEELP